LIQVTRTRTHPDHMAIDGVCPSAETGLCRLTLQINQRGTVQRMHVAGSLAAYTCAGRCIPVPHAVRTYASSNEPALRRWIDRSMRRPRKTFDPDDRSTHASITYFWPDRSDNRFARAVCAWWSTWRRFIFGTALAVINVANLRKIL
jgi:hypothetical protein